MQNRDDIESQRQELKNLSHTDLVEFALCFRCLASELMKLSSPLNVSRAMASCQFMLEEKAEFNRLNVLMHEKLGGQMVNQDELPKVEPEAN